MLVRLTNGYRFQNAADCCSPGFVPRPPGVSDGSAKCFFRTVFNSKIEGRRNERER